MHILVFKLHMYAYEKSKWKQNPYIACTAVPEFIINKIHLCSNNMHQGLWFDQYFHALVFNQLIEFPFFICIILSKEQSDT